MAKVLQRLARRGLLTSHQGTRGGYRLSRAAGAISVADIIQAIDGPLTVTACSTEDEKCGQFAKCNVRDPLWRIKDRILAALATCSLAEIATDVVPEPAATPMSFSGRRPGRPDRRAADQSDDVHTGLPRLPRDDARRSARARGDAAVLHRAVRQSREPAARVRLGGARRHRHGARRRSRRSSTRPPAEIVFTSGATESNNLALKGAAPRRSGIAATTSSPSRPSTSRCSTRASVSRAKGST